MNRWSDVIGILWTPYAQKAGSDPKALKYIYRQHIATREVEALIEEAAEKHSPTKEVMKWPGTSFKEGEEGFLALLGTPHGSGVAFLLAQYPDLWPTKKVSSITMFKTEDSEGYNLHLPPEMALDNGDLHLLFELSD